MESLFQVCVYAFKTLIEAFYQDNRRAMSCEKLVKHADFGKNGMVKPLGNKISADMEEYSSNPVGVYEGQALVDEPVALQPQPPCAMLQLFQGRRDTCRRVRVREVESKCRGQQSRLAGFSCVQHAFWRF